MLILCYFVPALGEVCFLLLFVSSRKSSVLNKSKKHFINNEITIEGKMKLNKLFVAVSTLLVGASAFAAQQPSAPQSAPTIHQEEKHVHGIPEVVNKNTPQAHSVYQPIDTKALHSLDKHSVNNTVMAAAACDVNSFATSNANTLINAIKSQGSTCVNELFNASSSIQQSAYSSDNMYSVANHLKGLSQSYTGGGDPDIEAMFLYLRAGYYVEFYNNNVNFVSWVKPAVKGAIDAFVNNAHFYDDNDGHGKTLSEVLITMDSSEQQDVYLPVVKEWLSRWNQSYGAKWNMRSAVNSIFTILFRGQYNDNFKALVANDTTLVSRLNSFTQQSWMVNSDSEYLIANAARELGRMKMYTGTSIQATVDSGLNKIFSTYQMYGNGDAVWLGAADTANYYGNCNDYNICGYGDQLEAQVLSQTHICSPTIKIRSQNLTATQQASACATMGAEETYFHNKMESGSVPIPGDNNDQLQVNIFDSSNDYGKYGGPIFGIDTNNGGMYLEGDPSVVGNIPNFVAYEADYAKADHYVWNLEHEYVHYLDGRFDLFGDFNTPTEKVVWWAEGVAEYVANQNNNQAAIDTIHDGSVYSLSAVFETTYDGFDQDRIYRWGYLAVRFMFERHFSEVKAMLAETRAGDWTAYKARLNTWVANYSNEFTTWTQTVTSDTGGGTNPPANEAPIVDINGPYTGDTNMAISFSSNGSYDPDGTISSYAWDFGDGSTSTLTNPSHTYTSAGQYTVSLTVLDNNNATATTTTSADISGVIVPDNSLQNGVSINVVGAQDSETFYTMEVPAGATDLSFETSGGAGDADLYVRFGSAPTTSTYDCRPWKGGNNETCTISDVQAGTYHVMLRGYNSFDTNLKGSFVGGSPVGNMPNACAVQGPQTGGELQNGSEACLGSGTTWLTIGDVSAHSSIAITSGNGTGNLDLEFSNLGWPNSSNTQGASYNSGNGECIYLTNLSEYWGYIKVSGESDSASIVVDFDTAGCR